MLQIINWMSKEKNELTATIKQKVLFQRTIIIISAFVLTYVTYYGHNITSQRMEVLKTGYVVKAVISRVTSKRSIKTIYVVINNVEYDAGDPIQECQKGDMI